MNQALNINQEKKPVLAYPSASIIVLRETEVSFEVLMARRSEKLRFAPGAYVFPGGKVDDEDYITADTHVAGYGDGAHRIAALRELAEETGVEIPLTLASNLSYFAHWITPPQSPKRFDTKFYLTHTSQAHVLKPDGTETQEAFWVDPHDMLKKEQEGEVKMMFPTRLNLMKLAQSTTMHQALHNAEEENIISVMPAMEMRGDEMWFTIPPLAGYPISEVKRDNIFELMGVKKIKQKNP